ncbi:hypothetical protein PI125_g25276 [Phytophthora idaei]|nr:hypothetical protein PI125_g25276 [Phytophthora idaei]
MAPRRGGGDVTTPTSSGRSRRRRRRGWIRRSASVTSYEVSNVTSSTAPCDCSEQLYTLVNGVTGEVDDGINLDFSPLRMPC